MILQVKNQTEINSLTDLSNFIMDETHKRGADHNEVFPKIFKDSFVERDLNRFIAKNAFFDPEFFQSSILNFAINIQQIDLETIENGLNSNLDFICCQIINKFLSRITGDFYYYVTANETGIEEGYTITIVEFVSKKVNNGK